MESESVGNVHTATSSLNTSSTTHTSYMVDQLLCDAHSGFLWFGSCSKGSVGQASLCASEVYLHT